MHDRLDAVTAPWGVVGGWAIDLHLGAVTREHDDIEIGVPAASFPEVADALAGFETQEPVEIGQCGKVGQQIVGRSIRHVDRLLAKTQTIRQPGHDGVSSIVVVSIAPADVIGSTKTPRRRHQPARPHDPRLCAADGRARRCRVAVRHHGDPEFTYREFAVGERS